MARIGRGSVEMVSELLESVSLWLFTEYPGWTAAQIQENQVLIRDARRELQDPRLQVW